MFTGGATPRAPYTGQIATACGRLPFKKDTATLGMSRTRHIARSAITTLKVAFPNFYVPGGLNGGSFSETAPGGNATIKAAIEYNGASSQLLWSGSASVTVTDGTISALSDALTISIPKDAAFFVRCYYSNSAGVLYNPGTGDMSSTSGADNSNGESYRIGSAVTDETLSTGAIANGTLTDGRIYCPILIVTTTTRPSVLLLGDSHQHGYHDAYTGTSGDRGLLARAFGALGGYCELGTGGAKASDFIASHTLRVSLAPYFSHVACVFGTNDITNGVSASTVVTNLQTIAGYFPNNLVWVGTIPPVSTSTDSWATTANQTTESHNANRVSLNGSIRTGISGFNRSLEIADILESARDSGKWIVDGSANTYTDDGTHGTNTAHLLVKTNLSLSAYV